MKLVAVSQRVDVKRSRGERRDALDQNWTRFLGAAGLRPLLMPNDAAAARELVAGLEPPMSPASRSAASALLCLSAATASTRAAATRKTCRLHSTLSPRSGNCRR